MFGLAFNNFSSRKKQVHERRACLLSVPLKVTGSYVSTTLKKTKPLTYSIPIVNVFESG